MFTFRPTRLIVTVLTLGLAACVGMPAKPPSLPQFQHVAVMPTGVVRKDLKVDSAEQLVKSGVAGGAAGGAAVGATVGLFCGPFVFVCAPVGAMIGGVTGAVTGGLVGNGRSLTAKHKRMVDGVLADLQADLELNEMLSESLSTALPDGMETGQSDAEAWVQVQVNLLQLRQYTGERLALKITAEMTTFWKFEGKKPTIQTNRYQYETAHLAVEDWLADEGKGFKRGLTQCVDHIVGYMARDLGQPGAS